jgi:hypothetical protein
MFKLIDCGRVSKKTRGMLGFPFSDFGAWPFNTWNGS